MKRTAYLSVLLGWALLIPAGADVRAAAHTQGLPEVFSASLEGKKLIVTGQNFAIGASILIDGQKQKTKNLADNPTGVLVAKKGGKQIGAAQVVVIQVVTPEGVPSNEFQFFGGPTITLADQGKTIRLSVGEQFIVMLGGAYEWTVDFTDLKNLVAVPTLIAIPGSQGIFEPVTRGRVTFRVDGQPACAKVKPPCAQPSLAFEVTLVIE